MYLKNKIKNKRRLLPAMLGSFVEFYDFSIYSFSAVILAPLFFPQSTSTFAIIQSYAIFAAGNLSRPLGSVLFGILGDRYGRKLALEWTIIGIAIPTFVIAILPTFPTIGYFAPSALLLCRIVQGIFVGGESDGVAIYLQESIGKNYACFANSLNRTASSCGILVGSLIVWLCNTGEMPVWSWRIPFAIGGALGLLTFFLRKRLVETREFSSVMKDAEAMQHIGITEIISSQKKKILLVILVCGAHGGIYNFFYVFWFNYLGNMLLLISQHTAELWKSISLLLYIVFAPATGLMADRIGLYRYLKYAIYCGLILIASLCVSFYNFKSVNIVWIIVFAMWVTALLAPGQVLLMNLFYPSIRYRCMSIGHSIGSAIFSGTAPAVGTYLWYITGELHYIPLLYFFFLVCVMGVGSIGISKAQNLEHP